MPYQPGLDPRPFNQLSPEEQAIRAGQTQPLRQLQVQSGEPAALLAQSRNQTGELAQGIPDAQQILNLLKQYQRGQQRQQVEGFLAPLPQRLQGLQLTGQQIQGFKRGEQETFEPTIGGIRSAIEEFQQTINERRKQELQEQEILAKGLDRVAAEAGGIGLRGLLKTDAKAFKAAGIGDPESYIKGVEAREKEEQRRFDIKESKGTGMGVSAGEVPGVSPTGQKYKFDTLQDIASLPISELTKSVIAGYGRVKDLSPTDKATVQTELYQVGYNPYEYLNKKLGNLASQWEKVPSNFKGLAQGRLQPFAASRNEQVANFESQKQVLTREVARLFDVGVLSDQDVATYKAAMPGRGDASIEVVKSKIEGLKTTLGGGLVANQQQGNLVRVRRKSDGKTGRIPESEFNPKTYIKI